MAVVTVDAPSTGNAITQPMLVALAATFNGLASDETVRCAVLTGTGRRAFSTGIDLGDAEKVFKMDENDRDKDVVHQMERCAFPIVGAVNGVAINAGFEMALACDILLASQNAAFVDTHAKLGIVPSWGLSQKLPRIVGANLARWASLACTPIDAETALRCGLVSEVVAETATAAGGGKDTSGGVRSSREETDEGIDASVTHREGTCVASRDNPRLTAAALAVARKIANLPRSGVSGYKRVMRDGLALPYGEAREMERRVAFAQYRALPESFFKRMKAAAGLTPRARL